MIKIEAAIWATVLTLTEWALRTMFDWLDPSRNLWSFDLGWTIWWSSAVSYHVAAKSPHLRVRQ